MIKIFNYLRKLSDLGSIATAAAGTIRILCVEDHPVFREGAEDDHRVRAGSTLCFRQCAMHKMDRDRTLANG